MRDSIRRQVVDRSGVLRKAAEERAKRAFAGEKTGTSTPSSPIRRRPVHYRTASPWPWRRIAAWIVLLLLVCTAGYRWYLSAQVPQFRIYEPLPPDDKVPAFLQKGLGNS